MLGASIYILLVSVLTVNFAEFRTYITFKGCHTAGLISFWGAVRDTIHTEREQLKEAVFTWSSGNPIYLLMDDAAVTASEIKRYYSLSNG